MLSPGALSLMERLLRTLLDGGLPADDCGSAADTLLSHVTGFVLQEQNQPTAPPTLTAGLCTDLRERFPLVMDDLIPRLSQGEEAGDLDERPVWDGNGG